MARVAVKVKMSSRKDKRGAEIPIGGIRYTGSVGMLYRGRGSSRNALRGEQRRCSNSVGAQECWGQVEGIMTTSSIPCASAQNNSNLSPALTEHAGRYCQHPEDRYRWTVMW